MTLFAVRSPGSPKYGNGINGIRHIVGLNRIGGNEHKEVDAGGAEHPAEVYRRLPVDSHGMMVTAKARTKDRTRTGRIEVR